MIERLKNKKTSAMGAIIFLAALFFIYLDKISVVEGILLFLLSYLFIVAKDSILEGISIGLFKPKSNE